MKYVKYQFFWKYLNFPVFIPYMLGYLFTSSTITPSRVFKTFIVALIRWLRISIWFRVPWTVTQTHSVIISSCLPMRRTTMSECYFNQFVLV
ncbi:hypothetical protein KC19_11G094800 [Ceratodon purpureus]|uniref:Uncharacterized protein n=1 Tax=Ceratodon purpureus TaxID=3225 RepID=A0A8T0GC95_CERPU|nr:hypothetical protein KC19_11G094800 [Ceratodon purpureus]